MLYPYCSHDRNCYLFNMTMKQTINGDVYMRKDDDGKDDVVFIHLYVVDENGKTEDYVSNVITTIGDVKVDDRFAIISSDVEFLETEGEKKFFNIMYADSLTNSFIDISQDLADDMKLESTKIGKLKNQEVMSKMLQRFNDEICENGS